MYEYFNTDAKYALECECLAAILVIKRKRGELRLRDFDDIYWCLVRRRKKRLSTFFLSVEKKRVREVGWGGGRFRVGVETGRVG